MLGRVAIDIMTIWKYDVCDVVKKQNKMSSQVYFIIQIFSMCTHHTLLCLNDLVMYALSLTQAHSSKNLSPSKSILLLLPAEIFSFFIESQLIGPEVSDGSNQLISISW